MLPNMQNGQDRFTLHPLRHPPGTLVVEGLPASLGLNVIPVLVVLIIDLYAFRFVNVDDFVVVIVIFVEVGKTMATA